MDLILVQPTLSHAPASDNVDRVARLLTGRRFQPDDILLLPERFVVSTREQDYAEAMRELAKLCGCHVVGGSQHVLQNGRLLNRGWVVDADGKTLVEYHKLRPYGAEQDLVEAGDQLGEVTISGRRLLILICADFWFSDVFARASALPDLVVVPALSVTRKPTPNYSKALWRHLAVARAYEFGVFVGVSDWATDSSLPALRTSGVGGFADPTVTDPSRLFVPIPEAGIQTISLDFGLLEAFRRDRAARGFFWKTVG